MKPSEYTILITTIVIAIGIATGIILNMKQKRILRIWVNPDCMDCQQLTDDLTRNNADAYCKRKKIHYEIIECRDDSCPVQVFPHIEFMTGNRKDVISSGYTTWDKIQSALSY